MAPPARSAARPVPIVDRLLKPLIWTLALAILGYLCWGLATNHLGADPVRAFQLGTGEMALRCLLASLAITPLRRLFRRPPLIKVRRLLGLWSFAFASVHLTSYLVFDHQLDVAEIRDDIMKHPWVLAGTAAWLLLLPLAATSTQWAIRRLGRRWQLLHRLVYPAAVAVIVHFLWLVKRDESEPLTYGAILAVLFALRWWSGRAPLAKQAIPG